MGRLLEAAPRSARLPLCLCACWQPALHAHSGSTPPATQILAPTNAAFQALLQTLGLTPEEVLASDNLGTLRTVGQRRAACREMHGLRLGSCHG